LKWGEDNSHNREKNTNPDRGTKKNTNNGDGRKHSETQCLTLRGTTRRTNAGESGKQSSESRSAKKLLRWTQVRGGNTKNVGRDFLKVEKTTLEASDKAPRKWKKFQGGKSWEPGAS